MSKWRRPTSGQTWRRATASLLVASFLVLALACEADEAAPNGETPTPDATPANASEAVSLTGFFSTMYGDPPADSDDPAVIEYWLEDDEGGRWLLVFDEDVYRPEGGIRQFDREQVEVQGMVTDEEDAILVTSIALADRTASQPATPAPTGTPAGATAPGVASNVETSDAEEAPPVDATPETAGSVVTLSGFFSTMYGDPPADSGLPSVIEYWLEDDEGGRWLLVFDEDVYRPAGGIRQFDRERVVVEGTAMEEEGTVLVTSIAVAE